MSRRNARIAAMMSLFESDMRTLFNTDKKNNLHKSENTAAENQNEALMVGGVAFAVDCVKGGEAGEDTSLNEHDLEFASYIADGTQNNLAAIDKLLSSLSKNWKLGRMVAIDRAVLRLAVFELHFTDDDHKAPTATVIDEAVSIAKTFGTEKSGAFVNGLLADVLKKIAG